MAGPARRIAAAALAGALASLLAAAAPQAPAAGEGALDSSVDTESRDTSVQLKALQQDLYSTQQYLYLTLFLQQYGDEIRAERTNIATVDAALMPVYIFEPKRLEPGRTYPGLVVVHGSYHGSLDPAYFSFIAAAVREGYIVAFPEYRGSRGYGAAYYDAVDFGGKEVDDVVAAADYLAETRPVPRDREAIFGRSKGGMIALLAIERFPQRFRAAVDVVGLTDMVAYMAYKPGFRASDIARQPRFKGKSISEDAGPYIDVSPLNHVDRIETPLLVHSTTGDKTAPVQLHGGRLIELLRAYNKIFEAKIYENAPGGHVFSQADTPDARDSQQRIFAFLARYLQPAPAASRPTP
jgi:dipeptidyl aminopeptidase/acylaminoacyl peptidase